MRFDGQNLSKNRIIINSTDDVFKNCRFDDCEIISTVDLCVDNSFIEADREIYPIGEQVPRINKNKPYARIEKCYLYNCVLPRAEYGGCGFHLLSESAKNGEQDKKN